MKFKTPCPTCGEPITFKRVITAPHPWALKCPYCKSKFKAKNHAAFVISYLTIITLGAILMGSLCLSDLITFWQMVAMYLILGLLLELSFSVWIVNRGLRHY